ncbi:cytochrome c3 family protein [Pseudodesulfovibrio sp. S3]|uniref:cytochrome c3 family protein n=1 Tax=Pseudodesulfovibrio sp. S3 TaxID=2283629 RepID=UPI001F4F852D|nr:cytochrome c3 family protein [Pseudodesulfovibrio sp. S3]MCJ2164054.1 cytochrome c family protein [Pseudodesulfovibrio sp. S3-i]
MTAILFLIAVGGYFTPTSSEDPPVRVLLENKGGKVILDHADHVQAMDQDCAACHHTSGKDPNPPACTQCHVKKFDQAFIVGHQEAIDDKHCLSCHHAKATIDNFSHEDHKTEYTDSCQACHHDPSIEPVPQACSNCHMDGSNSVPNLRDAAHGRCTDCHEDLYQEGLKGCTNCHVRDQSPDPAAEPQACTSCHTVQVEQLVPTSMNAFHGQCRGCHEKTGSGPFDDESCKQCHMQ